MTFSALVSLGVDPRPILEGLNSLGVGEFALTFRPQMKQGVRGLRLNLAQPWPQVRHGSYRSLKSLIEKGDFSKEAKDNAIQVFYLLALAEGKIHGIDPEEVHFHEVGAADSLLDIVGVCLALAALQPSRILASPITVGQGQLNCQHGIYPVPAPASLELLKGIPLQGGDLPFELATPTGAALAKHFVDEFLPGLPLMRVEQIGYGAGTFDLPGRPNILRAIWGEVS